MLDQRSIEVRNKNCPQHYQWNWRLSNSYAVNADKYNIKQALDYESLEQREYGCTL